MQQSGIHEIHRKKSYLISDEYLQYVKYNITVDKFKEMWKKRNFAEHLSLISGWSTVINEHLDSIIISCASPFFSHLACILWAWRQTHQPAIYYTHKCSLSIMFIINSFGKILTLSSGSNGKEKHPMMPLNDIEWHSL